MQFIHIFLAALTVCIWGFNFVVIKVGLSGIPPIFLVFCRFFLTFFPAIFFVKKPEVPFRMILAYGLIMFAIQFTLLFMGIYLGVTPGLAALLLQVQVFFTIFLAVIILKEKLKAAQIIGACLSFLGIGCIALNLGGEMTLAGFFLILGAAASWGPGNIIAKKMGPVNVTSLIVWGSFVAWPPLLLTSCLVEGPALIFSLSNLSWKSVGAALYITYCSTFFGFSIWNRLIHRYNLSMIAPFSLLSPVVGMVSSVLVFKEPLQTWKILAGALIITGLCINLLGSRTLVAEKAKDF